MEVAGLLARERGHTLVAIPLLSLGRRWLEHKMKTMVRIRKMVESLLPVVGRGKGELYLHLRAKYHEFQDIVSRHSAVGKGKVALHLHS